MVLADTIVSLISIINQEQEASGQQAGTLVMQHAPARVLAQHNEERCLPYACTHLCSRRL